MTAPDTAALAARLRRCPVHGIPDCSALLNGCSLPQRFRPAVDEALDTIEQQAAVIARVEALVDELGVEEVRHRNRANDARRSPTSQQLADMVARCVGSVRAGLITALAGGDR